MKLNFLSARCSYCVRSWIEWARIESIDWFPWAHHFCLNFWKCFPCSWHMINQNCMCSTLMNMVNNSKNVVVTFSHIILRFWYIRCTQIRLMATIRVLKSFVLSSRLSHFSYFSFGDVRQPHQFFCLWVWAFAHSKMAKRSSNYYLKYTEIRLEAELLLMISPIICFKNSLFASISTQTTNSWLFNNS